jgi:aerobic carbon-monoxide dehydrogenase small subunit
MEIKLNVNGNMVTGKVEAGTTLLRFLRDNGHTEVKKGCGEGECGACTVLLDGIAVTSCLVPAMQAQGKEITTIKKQGDPVIDALKESFVNHGAVQCGFCSPAMVLTAKWLLSENPHPTRAEIREYMAGNLCRCTGYAKIVDAIEEYASKTIESFAKIGAR